MDGMNIKKQLHLFLTVSLDGGDLSRSRRCHLCNVEILFRLTQLSQANNVLTLWLLAQLVWSNSGL
jgi:hypothetical protein